MISCWISTINQWKMAPNQKLVELEAWRKSGISHTYPSYRRQFPISEERCVHTTHVTVIVWGTWHALAAGWRANIGTMQLKVCGESKISSTIWATLLGDIRAAPSGLSALKAPISPNPLSHITSRSMPRKCLANSKWGQLPSREIINLPWKSKVSTWP